MRGGKEFSQRAATTAVPYHPWVNYRPKISKSLSGYTDEGHIVKLTTSAVWLTSSASTFQTLDVQANSVSDPFGAVGAVRPAGYTQYAALYNYYAVMGASIRVKAMAGSTTTTGSPHIFGVFPQAAANALVVDYNDALSQNRCKFSILDVTNGTNTASYQDRENDSVCHYLTTEQVMGQGKGYHLGSQNNAGFTANPSVLWYYTIFLDTVDSTSTYTAYLLITLTQYVRCWARKAVADA